VNIYKNTTTIQLLKRRFVMIKKNTLHLWFCALLSFCSLGVMAQASMPAANPQANVSISLEGVTVYDPHYLWQYAVEQITKRSGQPTLEQISKEIELIYREDGYFLSNVTISRSQSKTSLIVYEGRISKIEVSGASKELATAIHDYVQAAVGDEAVTLEKFERGIMLARDLSGVSLTSEFVSSQGAGDDVVRIAVNAVKQRGSLSLDNLPRNFGKGLYAVLSEEVYSTMKPGDMFRINVLPSADFNNKWSGVFGSLTYRAPFGSDGWYAEATVGTGLTRSLYTGINQTPQNLFQNTVMANVVVGYPIHRDAHSFLYTMSEVGYSALDNSLTGMNDTKAGVFRQFLVYSNNYRDGSTFRAGLTLTGGVADRQYYGTQVVSDPNFYHLRLGAGYTTPLSDLSAGLGLRLEASAQITTSSVPTTEKYFLGDRTRLRGYGYAELIGDSGIAATAEISQFYHVGAKYLDSVAPFAFFDAGWLKQNTPIPGMLNETPLASVGVGVQTRSQENFSVRAWVGLPLIAGYSTRAYSPAVWIQLTQAW
jgi:hemolysin activation/secretion protein